MYYLNSRYYSPELARFISSDGFLGTFGNVLSTNMYAYSFNNPVMFVDFDGDIAFPLIPFAPVLILAAIAVLLIVAADIIVEAIAENSNSKTKNDKSYEVYKLYDPKSNEVVYIGRTTNPQSRKAHHASTRRHLNYKPIASGLDYSTARGYEETYIIYYATLRKGFIDYNQIRGISPNNKNRNEYLKQAWRYATNRGENWILNILEGGR